MIGSVLLAAVLASVTADEKPGPGDWIARLGAASFDDRVAAYKALEQLGGEALPALRAAVEASDPRVRLRVRALLDSLLRAAELDRFSRPTMVRLDFRDRLLGDVVDALNERHGLDLVLQLVPGPRRGIFVFDPKAPDHPIQLRNRPVTLEAPGPVPFWEAVDRLCKAAALRYDLSTEPGPRSGQGSFTLLADRTGRGPVFDSGPIRVAVTSVSSIFERDFTGDPSADRPPATGELTVALYVLPEPGLALHPAGALTIEEAVDDQGRTLSARGPKGPEPSLLRQGYAGNMSGYAVFHANAELVVPEPPGKWIRRLRGSVPVVAVARRLDPLVIPLKGDGVLGKPLRTQGMSVVVDQAALAPGAPYSVVVTVRPTRGEIVTPPDPRRPDYISFRLDQAVEHMELVDAGGRKLNHMVAERTQGIAARERFFRFKLVAPPAPQGATPAPVPTELRYHEFVQTELKVPFDLRDIPHALNGPETRP